eukprot:TRINITY_DN49839_c0_g1_i1.p2 TRINITY_DN49839_c0_g1~~TRINITY_DN49839_c0_g1_i1.p2  ORF type:complete len:182 (+),score=38.25 TRINITY_DN49839_c0_g1_i1:91-636(+)
MWKSTAQQQTNIQSSPTDGATKVKKTIGWFNQHGNLKKPIIYKTIRDVLEKTEPRTALKVLKQFEEKADKIENPTYWLKKAVEREPDLDSKVRKTIGWYNSHGNLAAPISYPEVVGDLSKLSVWEQLQIVNQLEEKGSTIKDPTAWICKAAQKHSKSGKGSGKGDGQQKWANKNASWKKKW